jgi:hypothetical protein
MKKAVKLLIVGRIKDGVRASTFGCCNNTRILK